VKNVFWIALMLGTLPCFGGNGSHPVVPIALYTHFDQVAPSVIIDAMHAEIDAIMGPLGIKFEWRSLDGVRGTELSTELAVLTFKGHCDLSGINPRKVADIGALGFTHMSDGEILPFSQIECDRVRLFVQRDLVTMRSPQREETFGRALGRVVAHELYHIFANTTRHGDCGVGKAAYSVRELLNDDFQFEGKESLALQGSKARSAVKNANGPPTL
jgi:hypothetical protein